MEFKYGTNVCLGGGLSPGLQLSTLATWQTSLVAAPFNGVSLMTIALDTMVSTHTTLFVSGDRCLLLP